MNPWKNVALGWKFVPTDAELLWGYLNPEVHRRGVGGWGEGPIKFSDQVYKKPPWEFCTDSTTLPGDKKHYFFTELEKKKKKKNQTQNQNQNRAIRTVGSYGTWHESSSKKICWEDNSIMGFKKLLNFKEKVGKGWGTTDWLMHEFSVPGNILVLCVIQKKKKKEEEMGSAYDKYPEFDPKSCRVRDSTTSAGGDPCPAPAPAHDDQALDSEEEKTRPSKKMRSDPQFDYYTCCGGDPCPAPAHYDQALDSEEEKTRPSKKMRSDPQFDYYTCCGGDPCPAPAHYDQALDSEEEKTRPSKKMRSDPQFDTFSGDSSSVDMTAEEWDKFFVWWSGFPSVIAL